MIPLIRARTRFPHKQFLPSGSSHEQIGNHNYRKLTKLVTWITALSNWMELWAMLCRAQDRWVMVENSDKIWFIGEGNGKPLQYSCLDNPMKIMKKQKDDSERWTPHVGRCPICCRRRLEKYLWKNEEVEPKWKQCPVVDVTGDGSKVQCCSRSDEIPAELFQILKNGAAKVLHSTYQQIWKTAGTTGLEKVSFHSHQSKRQCQRMFKLPYNCTHFIC